MTLPSAPSSRGERRDSPTATGFSVAAAAPRSSSSAVLAAAASAGASPATDENSDRTHRFRSLGSSLSRPPAMRRRSPWLASSHPAGTCAVHVLVPSALMRLTNSGESASAFHSFLPTVVVRLQRASPPRKSEPYSARNTAAKTAKTMRLTPLNLPCDAPAGRAAGGEGGARMSRDVQRGGRGARGTFIRDSGRGGAGKARGCAPSSRSSSVVRSSGDRSPASIAMYGAPYPSVPVFARVSRSGRERPCDGVLLRFRKGLHFGVKLRDADGLRIRRRNSPQPEMHPFSTSLWLDHTCVSVTELMETTPTSQFTVFKYW